MGEIKKKNSLVDRQFSLLLKDVLDKKYTGRWYPWGGPYMPSGGAGRKRITYVMNHSLASTGSKEPWVVAGGGGTKPDCKDKRNRKISF